MRVLFILLWTRRPLYIYRLFFPWPDREIDAVHGVLAPIRKVFVCTPEETLANRGCFTAENGGIYLGLLPGVWGLVLLIRLVSLAGCLSAPSGFARLSRLHEISSRLGNCNEGSLFPRMVVGDGERGLQGWEAVVAGANRIVTSTNRCPMKIVHCDG